MSHKSSNSTHREQARLRPAIRTAWLNKLNEATEGQLAERQSWTTIDEIGALLPNVADGCLGVLAITGRHHPGRNVASLRPLGIEVFGVPSIVVVSHDKRPVELEVRFDQKPFARVLPENLLYIPCPHDPADGFLVLSVADPLLPDAEHPLLPDDYLQAEGDYKRLVAGGLVLAWDEGRLSRNLLDAPSEVWNDFPALVGWLTTLVDAPPARTTEESLEDPTFLRAMQRALAEQRALSGRKAKALDQADADALCKAAIAWGVKPTVMLLNKAAGRGSPTTLNPLVNSYFRRAVPENLLPGAVPTEAVPPVLLKVFNAMQAAARQTAIEELAPSREALTVVEQSLAKRDAELASGSAELARQRELDQAAKDERDRYVGKLEERVAALESELASARMALAGGDQEISTLRADLARQCDELRHHDSAYRAAADRATNLENDLVVARDELRLAAGNAAAAVDQLQQREREWSTQRCEWIEAAEQASEARNQARLELAATQAELKAEHKSAGALAKRALLLEEHNYRLAQDLGGAQAAALHLSSSLERASAIADTVSGLQQQLATVTAELHAVREEPDRLRRSGDAGVAD